MSWQGGEERPVLPFMPGRFVMSNIQNQFHSLFLLASERRRGVWCDPTHPPPLDSFLSLLLVTPLYSLILQLWVLGVQPEAGYLDPCVARRLGKRRLVFESYLRQTYRWRMASVSMLEEGFPLQHQISDPLVSRLWKLLWAQSLGLGKFYRWKVLAPKSSSS